MRYTALVNMTDYANPMAVSPKQAMRTLLHPVVKAAASAPACITVRLGEDTLSSPFGPVNRAWVVIERLGDVVRKDMKGTN